MKNKATEIYFLSHTHKSLIWGGDRLKEIFKDIREDSIGETWVVSSLDEDQSYIKNGEHRGLSLQELYKNEPQIFGNYPTDDFPLLIKYIDAKSNLSIQVHPDDNYARKNENSFGKSEFWLVLDSNDETKMILGHHYTNKKDFKNAVLNNTLEAGLNTFKIQKNETYYVPAGTVHAICDNSIIYEVQQNSKITYRIYDYGRLDIEGKERELHIDKALDVSDIPMKPVNKKLLNLPVNMIEIACNEYYFKIESLLIKSHFNYKCNGYFNIVGCIAGEGEINRYVVKTGDHILVPHQMDEMMISGNMHLIISSPNAS